MATATQADLFFVGQFRCWHGSRHGLKGCGRRYGRRKPLAATFKASHNLSLKLIIFAQSRLPEHSPGAKFLTVKARPRGKKKPHQPGSE
jgi:hypothetical protein